MYQGIIPDNLLEDPIFEVLWKKSVPGGSNAGFLGEIDKFSHGFGLHFPHDPAAVDLDRLKRSPALEGDLFT